MPPRVPLHDPSPDDEVATAILARRGGWLSTLDRVLLHSRPLANGWNVFYGAIRDEMVVSARLRELAILRVAHLNGSHHNWWHHEAIAKQAGFTDTEIESVRSWVDADCYDALDRAVLAYTDAVTNDVRVTDEVLGAVRERVSTRELVELTAIIASFSCANRVLVALGIDAEDSADNRGRNAVRTTQ